MSSEIFSSGTVAPAVTHMDPIVDPGLAVGVAVGAVAGAALASGWIAWQAGKLYVNATIAAYEYTRQHKADTTARLEQAARQKEATADKAFEQMRTAAGKILQEIEDDETLGGTATKQESARLQAVLKKVLAKSKPADVTATENATAEGLHILNRIIAEKSRLASIKVAEKGQYSSMEVAQFMRNLRLAVKTGQISDTRAENVEAANPVVVERAILNGRLAALTADVMQALSYADHLTEGCGMSASEYDWFSGAFADIEKRIDILYSPQTDNKQLKKGIAYLEEIVMEFKTMLPDMENEHQKMLVVYKLYAETSRAVGEPVKKAIAFRNSAAVEKELDYLHARLEKAKECAAIYEQLGEEQYKCYAWNQELAAMGYSVYARKKITELADEIPEHSRLGDRKLPFYQWGENELTQFYEISEECVLQLIIHADGSVSMETFAKDGSEEKVKEAQKSHCSRMKELYERLQKNWFISFDYQETEGPEKVTSAASRKETSREALRRGRDARAAERRGTGTAEPRHMQKK